MNNAEWKNIAELVGIAAIVASLIFVAFEMRQARDIASSEAYQARTDIERANILDSLAIPAFQSGYAKLYAGEDEALTPEELIVLEWSFGSRVSIWENDHFQYINGYLSDEHWSKTFDNMVCEFGHPLLRELITAWEWRDSFEEVIEQAKLDPGSDPNCLAR
jgi:hypothetical protein